MYSPCFVLPYHSSPLQWYTFDEVFTQTLPRPPPGAAAVGIAAVFSAGLGVGDAAAAAGAAAFSVDLSLFDPDVDPDEVADLLVAVDFFPPYQSLTPPCAAHAPRFDSAEVYVPSLHSPVDPAGACAPALDANTNPAANTTGTQTDFACMADLQ
jgi:hypothetical protein